MQQNFNAAQPDTDYNYLFLQSPVPAWIFDRKTLRFLDVNNAAIATYGYSKDEFLSMSIMDIRPDEEKDKLRSAMVQFGDTGTMDEEVSWRHRRKNGELFYVQIYYQNLQLGALEASLVQSIDINDKVLAERKNRELNFKVLMQEQQFEHILSTVTEVIWAVRISDFQLLYSNDACVSLYGYTVVEMINDKNIFLNSILPEDREKFFASVQRIIANGYDEVEFRIRHKDGSVKTIFGKGMFRKGEHGHPDMISGIGLDITSLRKTEEALKQSIARLEEAKATIEHDEYNLRAITNNTADLIWSVNKDGKLILANEPFKKLLWKRYSIQVAPGADMSALNIPAAETESWFGHYEKAFNGVSHGIIYEVTEGEKTYHRIRFNPILGDEGEVLGVSCFSTDVTEQRKQLIKVQLQNERLKEIAWIQSHKVRGPVASILGLIELIDGENLTDPENQVVLAGLKKEVERLDSIIHEVSSKAQLVEVE